MKRISATPRRLEYSNPHMEIHRTRADFGAFQKEFFVVELGPRAGIVALQEERVLLARQYRLLIDDYSWEIPGGRVDEGETPEAAALRECIEETGYTCSAPELLVEYYPGLDNFNNRTSVFYSEQVTLKTPFVPDPAEVVEIRWFTLEECLDMVFRREILDALTVAGLLACRVKAGQGGNASR